VCIFLGWGLFWWLAILLTITLYMARMGGCNLFINHFAHSRFDIIIKSFNKSNYLNGGQNGARSIQEQRKEQSKIFVNIWTLLKSEDNFIAIRKLTRCNNRIIRVIRVTRRVPLVEQELLFLLEYLSSHPVFIGVRVARSLVFCVMLFRSLFVPLFFFPSPLYCRITASDYPLVSSNLSCIIVFSVL